MPRTFQRAGHLNLALLVTLWFALESRGRLQGHEMPKHNALVNPAKRGGAEIVVCALCSWDSRMISGSFRQCISKCVGNVIVHVCIPRQSLLDSQVRGALVDA